MAISIDWGTGVIFVPKEDMLLVQSTPTEIRELNLDSFRLWLKSLEETEEGMVYPKTHNNYPVVTVSGVQLARVVELLPPYTVTFEDGQYAVNLVGANNNIGDRTNVNQVSVRSANSAGLVQTREIEFASFNGVVTIDVDNGLPGTSYPIGTPAYPVNNLTDAKFIANLRGFSVLFLKSNLTVTSGEDISNFTLKSDNYFEITLEDGSISNDALFETVTLIDGVMNGYWNIFTNCWIYNMTNFCGWLRNCSIVNVELAEYTEESLGESFFDDLIPMSPTGASTIKMNTNVAVSITNSKDTTKITDLTDGSVVHAGLIEGHLIVDSSCVGGDITVTGVGILTNNSSLTINDSGFMTDETVARTVVASIQQEVGDEIEYSSFNGVVTIDAVNGSAGTEYPQGTPNHPVDNLTDAVTIANSRGFKKLLFIGNYTIPNGTYLTGFIFAGQGSMLTTLTFAPGCIVPYCQAEEAKVTGTSLGMVGFTRCHIKDYSGSDAVPSSQSILVRECLLEGVVSLPSNYSGIITVLNCWSLTGATVFTFNMNGGSFAVKNKNFAGEVKIINCTSPTATITTEFNAGKLTIDSTVTAGSFTVRGVGTCVNNSTGTVLVDTTGLMQAREVEYSSFNGGVSINTSSSNSGTNFPIGTPAKPVNNLTDAMAIAVNRGFNRFYINGSITIEDGENISNYVLIGEGGGVSVSKTTITLANGCITSGTHFYNAKIQGRQNGECFYDNCIIDTMTNTHCQYKDCILLGSTQLVGSNWTQNHVSNYKNCYTSYAWYTIDYNHSPMKQVHTNFSGKLKIINCTDARAEILIHMDAGIVWVDSSCTNGSITVEGSGNIINESSNGLTIETSGLMSKETITRITWDKIFINTENGFAGTTFPIGTAGTPCNNLTDALDIARRNSIKEIHFNGEITGGEDLTDYILIGNGSMDSCIFNLNGALLNNVVFRDCRVKGYLNAVTYQGEGWAREQSLVEFRDCYLEEIENFAGTAIHCQIEGLTKVKPNGWFSSIETVIEGDFTVMDLQNSAAALSMDINSGWLQVINAGEGSLIELNVKGGEVSLDASCTGGEYYLEGVGTLFNDSAMTVKENHFLWDEPISYHQIEGSVGRTYADGLYDGFVHLDNENGESGTDFPVGTMLTPCNNFEDAIQIAESRKLSKFMVMSHSFTFPATAVLDNFLIEGKSAMDTHISIEDGASTQDIRLKNCHLDGVYLSGNHHHFERVTIEEVYNFSGLCEWYILRGTIRAIGDETCTFVTGWDGAIVGNGTIDCGGETGPEILFRGHYGGLDIRNHTNPAKDIVVNFSAGSVVLHDCCTAGRCVLSGIGYIASNNSTMTVIQTGLLNSEKISEAVWDNIKALTKNKFLALK